MGVVRAVIKVMSTPYVELGKPTSGTTRIMAEEEKERRGRQFRSKSVAWNEPMHLLQRMRSQRVSKAGHRSFKSRKDGQELKSPRPSKWTKFWRKLRFDGAKKVPAAKPEWLNYDSQSYAMNFEEDIETFNSTSHMPTISGPGAREIVTVLLTRSPTTHRNSGAILIPKPVISDVKRETNLPLWKRRSISAPATLRVRMRQSDMKRRICAGA
jgi:hypothetical protein